MDIWSTLDGSGGRWKVEEKMKDNACLGGGTAAIRATLALSRKMALKLTRQCSAATEPELY